MSQIKIVYNEDTPDMELESFERGCRVDVSVEVDGKLFNVFIISMTVLKQEFDREFAEYGFYIPEINMIVVNEVTKQEIEDTIKKLYQHGYFFCIENQFNIPNLSMNYAPGIYKVITPDTM